MIVATEASSPLCIGLESPMLFENNPVTNLSNWKHLYKSTGARPSGPTKTAPKCLTINENRMRRGVKPRPIGINRLSSRLPHETGHGSRLKQGARPGAENQDAPLHWPADFPGKHDAPTQEPRP